ncbi:ethanolamine ammonia-lyase subunit EutC [Photobacterium sp. DNB23_23_1]|uniref:Ethanolamine ammonia-lyase small subunit n=1 Tax=Photobacterium pectinilyticum TaxID=2906793 RepID=A0ABT1N504_9GAMM|nr:ethanolamine ammonia-lyase subunit EutC [Photobacterium sp. ZSDE20]MCQ1059820.1 ethanolamine ammonia-lyase subunit EutC [Photobacterium sp. ZSDE20]MDD1826320.1 ethanolamine ammonia-lyase subunit EutC [Photobacterium sp. ZSDE20]
MGKVIALAEKQFPTEVVQNPWCQLRAFTSARIALGRSGNSIPTKELLSFQLDHAQAMDAVHCALDTDLLVSQLVEIPSLLESTLASPVVVESKVTDRLMYLQRPDLGRQLNDVSWLALENLSSKHHDTPDLAIVIADGLSSTAIQSHAVEVVSRLFSMLGNDREHEWDLSPISVVKQGRVAVADDISQCFNAKMALILIGERPGLTSPDSMGMYLTWGARRGAKDSHRNCISNVRPGGLSYDDACNRALYLLKEARKLQLSGVNLKDRSNIDEETQAQVDDKHNDNFLISQP